MEYIMSRLIWSSNKKNKLISYTINYIVINIIYTKKQREY